MSTRKNPNKIVYDEPLIAERISFDGKQVELEAGGQVGLVTVRAGSLKLSGELSIGQIMVLDPTGGDGAPDNGLYLSNASGYISLVTTLGTKRDHGKIGSDTHDLLIGCWYGRCAPPDPTPPGQEPVHRDGLQVSSAQRVTLRYFDFLNAYPGATNGGVWINPQKSGNPDADDPTLVEDFVVEGGVIANPSSGVHLGYCTRCGVRNTILVAQRPIRTHDYTIDPIGLDEADGNTLVPIELVA
jgi:hypothetical protein